jgi:hypothetical protein
MMTVTGIASTILTGLSGYQHRGQSKVQQLAGEFQQLAQDVQSGNLTQAQQHFTTLAQNISGVTLASASQSGGAASAVSGTATGTTPTTGTPSSTNPLIQEFNQLGQDLQSGNVQGARQDITNIENTAQQNVQANVQQSGHHHHHHRVDNDQTSSQSATSGSSSSGFSASSLSQLTGSLDQAFGQLSQSLQSGNLQGAQQAFSLLQNDLQQIGGFISTGSSTSASATSTSAGVGSLNVTA